MGLHPFKHMTTPFWAYGYTLFAEWCSLVVVGKSGSMADFSFLKKKWQNSLDLLTEKVT